MTSPRAMVERIKQLQKEKDILILAHNYVRPEIQDIADYVGDSLGLSRQAALSDHPLILFCAVHFMAETAEILTRADQTVLIPDRRAGCSLADMITAPALRDWKAKHPDALVVAYVNTSADVKAESDICCTSANAAQIVSSLPHDREILFLPDMFLGAWVEEVTGRKMEIWPGECHVHATLPPDRIKSLMVEHTKAEFLIHPECGCSTQCLYLDSVGELPSSPIVASTGGMVRHVKESDGTKFIVATETGILHPLKKSAPHKVFIPASEEMVCQFMKMVTLPKVLKVLEAGAPVVSVPEPTRSKARAAIDRMLAVTV
ncbi:quinolinate synthase NadA [bacterium]|nr:quinolinate synthase NadA [bacterium]